MIAEEWREVPGFPGYFASNFGRIRGRRGWELSPAVGRGGYEKVTLYAGGLKRNVEVHRAVALAFLGPDAEGRPLVAHGDGNPRNNTPENLRWATYADNAADRDRHGRTARVRGEDHRSAKVTADEVRGIRAEYARGALTQAMLGEAYGLTHQTVWSIIHRQNWRHLDA
ncbi:NUMOD4 motif-containing HNH endonuclease [Streptomyces sp. NPDC096057]|uniref:NUMOD4 motif-containing HNH endonuclease n=1 Tax=Streptomyces sp. NPDC096057 TaxID=3155543 RepID=UPI0033295309